ncbi:hypothetical protein HPP92_014959 [Vanilla planifolia]|uniref:TF-B3 domain-containing protein n=1 Tax=Vanilla planifolia TaxID=51239 RepID=A0A835QQK2_VANPL|nr:hypothetical protein HPP92_014959 [Vanilla planifolia]
MSTPKRVGNDGGEQHHLLQENSEKECSGHPSFCQNEEHSVTTQESNNAVPDLPRARQDNNQLASKRSIAPLMGIPYFTSIMSKSQVQSPYLLVIPNSFNKSLPRANVAAVLVCGGKTWDIKYCGDCSLRRFGSGWKKFAKDNDLKIGDGCIFELMDNKELKFRVQILDGQIPTKFVKRGSSDRPICID